MMSLFAVRNVRTNALVKDDNGHPLFFADKMEAKALRRQLNPTDEDGSEKLDYVVSVGPGHYTQLNR